MKKLVDVVNNQHEMDSIQLVVVEDTNSLQSTSVGEQPLSVKVENRTFFKSQEGNLLAIMSALSVSLAGVFYKKATTMNGSDNSIFRYVIQLITMLAVLKYKRIALLGPKEQRNLLLLRSFFGIFAVVFSNFAIKYIDPSDNVALSHTNIILTAIAARIFLKEKLGLQHILALLITITGVVLITKPSFLFQIISLRVENQTESSVVVGIARSTTTSRLIGVMFALIGACGSAAIHVVIKKLCINKVYFGVTTLYGTFLGLPASILTSGLLITTGVDHKNMKYELEQFPFDLVYGLTGGAFAVMAHVLFNLSLTHEDATKVATVRTIDVLFSFIFQFILLNIEFNLVSLAGAFLITLGTLIILFFKNFDEKIKCLKI